MALLKQLKRFGDLITPKTEAPRPQSKEAETPDAPYSHGLELIYQLETIDPGSVRTIVKDSEEKEKSAHIETAELPEQLPLELGEEYVESLPSFRLLEPIQVLELSQHAQRCLIEHEKFLIEDVAQIDQNDFVFIKGLGQGHIDEIQRKLSGYLEGSSLQWCTTLDFNSLVRCVAADMPHALSHLALKDFGLETLISLSPAETTELRHSSAKKCAELKAQGISQLQGTRKQELITEKLQKVERAFIKPWMWARHHLASKSELIERVTALSHHPDLTAQILDFLSVTYRAGRFAIAHTLEEVEAGVFASDAATADSYHKLIGRALSYFYDRSLTYPLPQLVSLLSKEIAREWGRFSEEFTLRALRLSPRFRVRKAIDEKLHIRLA